MTGADHTYKACLCNAHSVLGSVSNSSTHYKGLDHIAGWAVFRATALIPYGLEGDFNTDARMSLLLTRGCQYAA